MSTEPTERTPPRPGGSPRAPRSAPAVSMSDADFEAAVADGLDMIPEELAARMDNVVVLIADEPEPEQLGPQDYDADGLPALLGLYDGVPLTERDDGWSMVLPDRIHIFQGPLERWCTTREELVEEVAVTVIHEVAHHFGIDDARLHELGWE